MKSAFRFTLLCISALTLWGCWGTDKPLESSGRNYELLVVCPELDWNSALGDTLREILLAPVPMLNQREPLFDLYQIAPTAYKKMFLRNRNILEVKISPNTESSMTAQYDVNAAPQLIVTLSGPSDSALTAYVSANREALVQIYEIAERDRFVAATSKYYVKQLTQTIEQHFGFEIRFPEGYRQRNLTENFMWVSLELPLGNMGFLIYKYPYEGKEALTLGELLKRRNEFAALVPGPSEGSYMTTSTAFTPEASYQKINDQPWAVMRGFWDVEGDFMGGPFVSFTTINPHTNEVITLDGYVFNPKLDGRTGKRNYIRQLENIIHTVRFTETSDEETAPSK